MATRSLAEIVAACGGTLYGGRPELSVAGAAIDSRKVAPGNLFVALPGARADGHAFVADAFARGAAAALVKSVTAGAAGGGPLVVVDDPLAALHALTRAVRHTLPRRGLVAVTGSAGKTTTKELTGRLLAGLAKTATSPGNLNNLLGFPLALLGADDDAAWLVAELGMSTPGELAAVAALARPDVAVYTCIRPVHLASFGTLEAIAEAKAELLGGLAAGGLIVANADDPQVMRIVRRHLGSVDPTARLLTYAVDAPEATVRASDVHPLVGGRGSRFRLDTAGTTATVELPLLGRHNVENALAAATVALALGATPADVAASLAQARPAPMRGVVHGLPGDVTLIDDSYNSNPAALERALEAAAAIPAARRWAVLGDMLELGEQEAAFHRRAGERAAALGFDPVLAVGGLAAELAAGVVDRGGHARTLPDAASAAARVAEELRPGDLVLVKGSRGIGLERVVAALLDAARATADAAAGGRG